MALNKITKNKVMSYPDNNIFTIINNRSNIADPKNRGSTGKLVYRNDPWNKGGDFGDFPYIILKFPKIEKQNKSLSGTVKDYLWKQELVVRTGMNGAINNSDGTSKAVTDMQAIIDDLHETFDSATIKDQLRVLGHYDVEIAEVDNDELIDDDGRHVFQTTLEVSYNSRLNLT